MNNPTDTKVINFNQPDNSIEQVAQSQYAKYLPPQGMSRARDILPFLPFGRTTLHEWSNDGRFPASIKLSPTMVAWRNSDVLDWLEAQGNHDSNDTEGA